MTTQEKAHRWIMAALHLILVGGVVIAMVQQAWLNAVLVLLIFLLTLLPSVIQREFGVHLPQEFEIAAILFIFSSFFLGEMRDYYTRFPWWDLALHTTSGLLLGLVGFMLVYALNRDDKVSLHMKPGFVALFSFAFAVMIGAQWEIFEYTMDAVFGLNMQKSGLVDTMWDLIVDSIGAFVVAVFGYGYMKRGTQSFVQRIVERFVKENPQIFDETQGEGT